MYQLNNHTNAILLFDTGTCFDNKLSFWFSVWATRLACLIQAGYVFSNVP